MRLPVNPGVVGADGSVNPKALSDFLSRVAIQLNGISEGQISAHTTARTAAPTTGTWEQGRFIRNSAPSGGAPVLGWVCTVSGTPGTWVAIS